MEPMGLPYPCLEYRVTEEGRHIFSDGFKELLGAPTDELAGMGLAIIGNVVQLIQRGMVTPKGGDATLVLHLGPGIQRTLPWPGMPDDSPLPLDVGSLPFDANMFLDPKQPDTAVLKRVNRLELMRRIESVWVPYLVGLLPKAPEVKHA